MKCPNCDKGVPAESFEVDDYSDEEVEISFKCPHCSMKFFENLDQYDFVPEATVLNFNNG